MSDIREYFLGGIRTKSPKRHIDEKLLGSYNELFRDDFGEAEHFVEPYVILIDDEMEPGDISEPEPMESHVIRDHIDEYLSETGNINTFSIDDYIQ